MFLLIYNLVEEGGVVAVNVNVVEEGGIVAVNVVEEGGVVAVNVGVSEVDAGLFVTDCDEVVGL